MKVAAAAAAALMATAAAVEAPRLAAPSYILIDVLTGRSLAEMAADEPHRPASLAKMMTAYLAFEAIASGRLQLDAPVAISAAATATAGHNMQMRPGDEVALRDLLLAMIHRSGNDAAAAIAEAVAGSRESFVAAMNRKAAELGMKNTVFKNPSGLPAPGARSTARDLARLAERTIVDFPQLYGLYGIEDFEFAGQFMLSRNRLLGSVAGLDGLKTGHTFAAGYCLAASAMRSDREGMRLIAVLLGAASESQRNQEVRQLLEYGYRNWQSVLLLADPDPILGQIRVWGGQQDQVALRPQAKLPIKLLLPRPEAKKLSASLQLPDWLEAPLAEGQVAGSLIISAGSRQVMEIPAVASAAVAAGPWWKRASDFVRLHWISPPQRTAGP